MYEGLSVHFPVRRKTQQIITDGMSSGVFARPQESGRRCVSWYYTMCCLVSNKNKEPVNISVNKNIHFIQMFSLYCMVKVDIDYKYFVGA